MPGLNYGLALLGGAILVFAATITLPLLISGARARRELRERTRRKKVGKMAELLDSTSGAQFRQIQILLADKSSSLPPVNQHPLGLGAQGHSHSAGKDTTAWQDALTRARIKLELLGRHEDSFVSKAADSVPFNQASEAHGTSQAYLFSWTSSLQSPQLRSGFTKVSDFPTTPIIEIPVPAILFWREPVPASPTALFKSGQITC